jgi:Glutaredoxin-like domain (DUF836)
VSDVRLTLIGKPDCHLCEDAREVVTAVLADFANSPTRVSLEELSILDDDSLREKYWEDIPVVLVDGAVHTFWRVDPTRLTAAIEERA